MAPRSVETKLILHPLPLDVWRATMRGEDNLGCPACFLNAALNQKGTEAQQFPAYHISLYRALTLMGGGRGAIGGEAALTRVKSSRSPHAGLGEGESRADSLGLGRSEDFLLWFRLRNQRACLLRPSVVRSRLGFVRKHLALSRANASQRDAPFPFAFNPILIVI